MTAADLFKAILTKAHAVLYSPKPYVQVRQTLQSRIGSQAGTSLSATSFWLCQGEQEGLIEWSSMTNYMLEKLTALRTLKYLMRFDTLGSGFLSKVISLSCWDL